jgi:SAM-dependent methyltransferase
MSQREEHLSDLDAIAEGVRDFYDQHPYPQPVVSLDKYRLLWQDQNRRRAEYHLYWPASSYRENQSVLVAGCGTSQAARHALRWPSAQVTGIDFSATSVHYTEELKRKYNLNNLNVHQLPIERVNDFGMSFDQIICTGVLHHLPDPDAGLKALRDVLAPDGAIHLMVYASYGRTGVYMLQEFCRRIGIRATDEGIQDLIAIIKALPPGHPLENLLQLAPDFHQEAELADALLNPQDRAYSVPQLFDLIKKSGLTFGRWLKQAPYLPQCGALSNISLKNRFARLSLEEQFAAVELFRGTLVRHSVILYRSDSPSYPHLVNFTGDAWSNYIPLHMSDTICVSERLPQGAAAVLINQAHTYKDLFMPINTIEKLWYEAIDGSCRIEEIIKEKIGSSQKSAYLDMARTFYERLWWYDQVVFDASGQ